MLVWANCIHSSASTTSLVLLDIKSLQYRRTTQKAGFRERTDTVLYSLFTMGTVIFDRGYYFLSIFIFCSICAFTVTHVRADNLKTIAMLRERLRRLESRLSEDISLIREVVTNADMSSSVETDNGNIDFATHKAFQEEMETLKQVVRSRLNIFTEGAKVEKRLRRDIQAEVRAIKDDNVELVKLFTNMSSLAMSKLDTFADRIDVDKRFGDITGLLQNISVQLGKVVKSRTEVCNERVTGCADLLKNGHVTSGVYTIFPETIMRPLKVYCDMETSGGGWTVFQRRQDGSENFNRKWMDYALGFGDLTGEFWLGNENIHRLVEFAPHELRIELEDFDNDHRVAKYGLFSVGSVVESFKLSIGDFSGNVTYSLNIHNGLSFSTTDHGSSTGCADSYKGGWWYGSCHAVNINGLYLKGEHASYADGVNWRDWRGYHYSLKKTEMKFRPK